MREPYPLLSTAPEMRELKAAFAVGLRRGFWSGLIAGAALGAIGFWVLS